jgi:hypothetical protein
MKMLSDTPAGFGGKGRSPRGTSTVGAFKMLGNTICVRFTDTTDRLRPAERS